jgi:hypothetical protein
VISGPSLLKSGTHLPQWGLSKAAAGSNRWRLSCFSDSNLESRDGRTQAVTGVPALSPPECFTPCYFANTSPRRPRPYRPRSCDWVKVKNRRHPAYSRVAAADEPRAAGIAESEREALAGHAKSRLLAMAA